MFDVKNLANIRVGLASPEQIRSWSHGEVINPETINYRHQKPEPGGLFCEKIFGPTKDYTCRCGKHNKIKDKGLVCSECGVEVTTKDVRRERMGHIELCSPCTHIWYLKGSPSRISILLDMTPKQIEEIAYFVSHVVLEPGKCTKLSKNQYINDKLGDASSGRNVMADAIDDLIAQDLIPEGSPREEALLIKENLANPSEPFDFYAIAKLISKYGNVVFGEGADAIKKMLHDLDIEETYRDIKKALANEKQGSTKAVVLTKKLEVVEAFRNSKNKPEWMVLDVIPVIPPDLRPLTQLSGGRFGAADLNDLYKRVITRNNRLKKMLDIHAPSVIVVQQKRLLQQAVDSLIDNGKRDKPVLGPNGRELKSLSSTLRGKQGRFRQNLLGKRVDYSGRSVIAVGPDLKMYQCGLPREMAVKLLRPFIIQQLIKNKDAYNPKQADKLIDRYDRKVFDIVERIISDHPVLLNRAPTLHRLGIQAFQPKLVEGRAIRLHPLVCKGFNADFDGDQMAVHVPLSKAAQKEALDLMLASNNILGPKDGKPIVAPSQDMVLGNYYITYEETKEALVARAGRRQAKGDIEEYELYTTYGNAEGKVFRSVDEVLMAYQTKQAHLHTRIAIRGSALKKVGFTEEMNNSYMITTIGKVIWNTIFPADFPYLNDGNSDVLSKNLKGDLPEFFAPRGTDIKAFVANQPCRKPCTSKGLEKIIDEIYRRYGRSKTSAVLDKIKDIGFKYSTCAGFTIALSDIPVLQGKAEIIDEAESYVRAQKEQVDMGLMTASGCKELIIKKWGETKKTLDKRLKDQIENDPRNPVFMMQDSGARGNMGSLSQLCAMRGLMQNPHGETIEVPVKSCFRDGMTVDEYFVSTHGARKGGADTALKTADSGYLTRRLVDVSQDVIVREDDCHTDQGFIVKAICAEDENGEIKEYVPLFDRIFGRYSLRPICSADGEVIVPANTLITETYAKAVVAAGIKEVEIRSIFGCKTKNGVCAKCYGLNLATGEPVKLGEAVGIMAAQSIGEPGTQLTMRTFNTGGVAGKDITKGLPRVTELVEARKPKGKAVISKINGTVVAVDVDSNNKKVKISVQNDIELQEHESLPGAIACVKVGDVVKAGDKLTEGVIAPKELLNVASADEVKNYILNEIQLTYNTSNNIKISDKHIEIIISQMMKKVEIKDSGDTNLIIDSKVDIDEFTQANAKALLEGKRPAIAAPLVLGIAKAALESKSFLSAASFQETTRVLTDAVIKGKVDPLHGLKENVITGKLIPAGNGLLSEAEQEELVKDFTVAAKMKEVKAQYIEVHDRVEDDD